MQCSGKMANTTSSKNRSKFDKFTTIAGINFFNFSIELIFDHSGKVNKNKRHIRLVMHRKEPAVLDEMINKKYIITVTVTVLNVHEVHTSAGCPKQCLRVLVAMPTVG